MAIVGKRGQVCMLQIVGVEVILELERKEFLGSQVGMVRNGYFFVLSCFLRQGLSEYPWLSWN